MYKEFIEDLEKDLRRKTNKRYLFSDISEEYLHEMVGAFDQLIQSELEFAITSKIKSPNSTTSFDKLNELLEYASKSGIAEKLNINLYTNLAPKNEYRTASQIAGHQGDTLTEKFLWGLAE